MLRYRCPVCSSPLELSEKSYKCVNGHCYDLARSGYVNLLPPMGKGKRHGDDRLMVKARTQFLGAGYYDPFSNALCRNAVTYGKNDPVTVDAGCGEGKYTHDIYTALLAAGSRAEVFGTDISKDALSYAAKQYPEIRFAAANSSSLPFPDNSADMVLNIFSPFIKDEFMRILKPGGILIRAVPLENHLFELKAAIYDRPYLNDAAAPEAEGFQLLHMEDLKYRIHIRNASDINALFMMTPYYYKTGAEDQKKLASLHELETQLEFRILVYSL